VAGMTPLTVPGHPGGSLPGLVSPQMLAASRAGRLIAYQQVSCRPVDAGHLQYDLNVDLLSREMEWGQRYDPAASRPAGISLSADGTTLSVAAVTPGARGQGSSYSVWTMPARAIPATQAPPAHLLLGPFQGSPPAAALSPSGSVTYVAQRRLVNLRRIPAINTVPHGSGWTGLGSEVALTAYRTADGRRLSQLAAVFLSEVLPRQAPATAVTADASGGELLVSDTSMSVAMVSVATGRVTVVRVHGAARSRLVSVAW
jgi:hypothetical protein